MFGTHAMKSAVGFCLAALLFLSATQLAHAAISCSVSSPGFSGTYTGTLSITQTNLTVNCSRLASDPATSAYSIRPDNGIYASGQQNRGAVSTYFLNYEEYQDSSCSTIWRSSGGAGNAISGTVSFGTSLSASVNRNYWGCVPASQTRAAGTYTDTVIMTLTYNNGTSNVTATGTHSVAILSPASCTFSTAPGMINFAYTAMQAPIATANTTFGTTCTVLSTYSISITPGSDVVSGLNYSLRLNTTSSGGSNPLGSTGTGVQQIFYINGTMPASQAGACATGNCVASRVHTLTLSF